MKNFLKKFHVVGNQSEDGDGSNSSKASKSSDMASVTNKLQEHKPFSGFSTWLNSVTSRKSPSPPSSLNVAGGGRRTEPSESVSSAGLDATDSARRDSGSNCSRDPDVEEEYQIQIALELSVKEDPEAVEIEAVKQISLGSSASENTPAEVVAYRYWNYNALTYDDKIVDGFYDLCGIVVEPKSKSMPSLIDLQGTPLSEVVTWEAVLVNRAADANLLKLEEKALEIAFKSRSKPLGFLMSDLVKKIAILVSDYMGGTVGDSESMFRAWQRLSHSLKSTLGSMVLPLGSLTMGLARHRALMFKVLADGAGIPCRLVKGHLYTGSDDVAMNFVKIEDGREYIVDLMADPGTLIPADATGLHVDYDDSLFPSSPLSRDIDSSHNASSSSGVSSSGVGSSIEEHSGAGTFEKRFKSKDTATTRNQSYDRNDPSGPLNISHQATSWEGPKMPVADSGKFSGTDKMLVQELPGRPTYPYALARSPSWTEGISSPAAHRRKVKDVSEYMIDAAKENPKLAQKLHDVLLESGVVAPPNLFSEVFHKQSDVSTSTEESIDCFPRAEGQRKKDLDNVSPNYLPHLPQQKAHPMFSHPSHQLELPKPMGNKGADHPGDVREVSGLGASSQSEVTPTKYVNNVPVAAAAAAAAAVVASSMVVAARSNLDTNLELPAAAAATATAAAVVATTAAVSKYEQRVPTDEAANNETYGNGNRGCGAQESHGMVLNSEVEIISDRSMHNDSSKSGMTMDDVEEIQWDEILLGERIGLGSYGEVYRGEWRGTEVAVKRFLDQDISGQSLLEFRSEVKLMQRFRHPNVVLFMGAVTRPPNLSIVTEFLPRGSLYRLIHRPNNQLDERKRMRMALDAARGMNYLHSCSPVIVHRDLKSPNLLVDRNWVVKVCDFGLSRMKHSTFLSSRSTAGTAEWMAPEVLRNEPSDEKCDVYSYGVILWELCTLQQPWWGMNPMQVVGAVGFQHRLLDIPNDIDPAVADIIRQCWQTDPRLRPSFAEIMAALKPLQKPLTNPQVPRPIARGRIEYDKGRPSHEAED